MPSDSQPTTDEPAPMPRRLSEATAAFLLEFPRGYDLPPLEIIVQQINAALRAADAADAQGRSEATRTYADGLRAAAALLDLPMQAILLAAGEMTAQERRTVRAVLDWRMRAIQSLADEVETNARLGGYDV